MFLSHLELVQYKNHENQIFDFDSKFNVFIGKNGVGKTNILDAIYYLANFRSHITSLDQLNIKQGADFFRIYGKFKNGHEVLVKYAPRSKTIEINQVKVQKYSDAFGHLPIVLACPADIFLLHDGSEERRKFIDYTIATYHKEYLQKLNLYNHFLEQRNAHIKQAELLDRELIQYYNQHLAELGHAIYAIRKPALTELEEDIILWYQTIAQQDDHLTIEYTSQLHHADLSDLLKNSLSKDLAVKRTTAGVHRDDISIKMHEQDLKKIASQGQQKSLLYALRLAQAAFLAKKLQQKPIFLLDDFSDKLDAQRQSHLIEIMQEIEFVEQWFISDTGSVADKIKENVEIFQLS
ncbi:MAG: DNA replication/repair protein RecF [Chitinophagales bacterium]|nr:DNA replication and repair protein RecF [Sphingobacteriales bacterium]